MSFKEALIILAAPIALASAPAEAAIFNFDLNGSYNASFGIDTDLLTPPSESGDDYFLIENIAGVFDGLRQVAPSIQFSTAAANGGFTIELADGEFLGFFGLPLFTGSTMLPQLTTGTFTLASDFDSSQSFLTITAAAAAVPEPASWAMMLAGFGAVGFTMRRRTPTRVTVRAV
jgi:hypothetical protein